MTDILARIKNTFTKQSQHPALAEENQAMSEDLLKLDTQLNADIMSGKALEAFEEYYAEDVIMQENDEAPTVGKDANREREKAFFAAVTEVRDFSALSNGAGVGVTFSLWHNDFTHKEYGPLTYHQVAVRTWKDGKIVKEVFYHA